jgi:hypothetical protein
LTEPEEREPQRAFDLMVGVREDPDKPDTYTMQPAGRFPTEGAAISHYADLCAQDSRIRVRQVIPVVLEVIPVEEQPDDQ